MTCERPLSCLRSAWVNAHSVHFARPSRLGAILTSRARLTRDARIAAALCQRVPGSRDSAVSTMSSSANVTDGFHRDGGWIGISRSIVMISYSFG